MGQLCQWNKRVHIQLLQQCPDLTIAGVILALGNMQLEGGG